MHYYVHLNVKVMTGSLQLEDLPKLDKMVNDFDAITEDGPNKILRGKLNGKAKHFSWTFEHIKLLLEIF